MAELKLVEPIRGLIDMPAVLRNIADKIESGEYPCDHVTAIVGYEVFCFGPGVVSDERAAECAIFDMQFGTHKMLKKAFDDA